MHLNMLPIRLRQNQIVKRRAKQWTLVWSGALAAALLVAWFRAADCRRLTSELVVLEARNAVVKKMQADLRNARLELQDLEQREALVLELSKRRPMLVLLGILSRAARECEGNVSVTRIVWQAENSPRGEVPAGANGSSPSLTLEGIGLSNVWVARFAAVLRDDEITRDVQLTSTQQRTINDHRAHGYNVVCHFD
jgi:hypothetical protein